MKIQALIYLTSLTLLTAGCGSKSLKNLSNKEINKILSFVNENDPAFVEKGISFDSVATYAGIRTLNNNSERIKARLYFFGNLTRGYFNLADFDEKNLQVFGKKVNNTWALKCVTKLNMEEAGGYIILDHLNDGIWSNGHHSFKMGTLSWSKQNIDYDILQSW